MINTDIKKKSIIKNEEKEILDYISIVINIYQQYVIYVISQQMKDNIELVILNVIKKDKKLFDIIFKPNNIPTKQGLKKILILFQILKIKKIHIIDLVLIMDIFSRKIFTKKISKEHLRDKIFNEKNDTYMKNLTHLKYVNWLLNT